MFMDWSLILLVLVVWALFLIKTGKAVEACTGAETGGGWSPRGQSLTVGVAALRSA